jgi:two-component system sensor histidine kinase KdpD
MRDREERTDVLYQVLKDISDSPDKKEIIRRVTERVGKLLGAQCHVVLRQKDGALDFPALQKLSMPIDEGLYLPLRGLNEDVGVFAFIPEPSNEKLSPEHLALLKSIVGQLGISLERHLLRQRLIEAQRLKDSETLHQTLLNSISHEMRTPLTTILSAAEALNDQAAEMGAFRELSKSLNEAGDRLNHVIENLLDMSRLSSGILALQLDWQDLNDLVGVVLAKNSKMILHHSVQVQLGTEVDLIRIDFRLFEHALSNLVLNAVQYTPAQSEIRIIARRDHHNIRIAIVDNGPGIPVASAPYIFDKFFRVAGSPPGGTGLGLSIVKSIVELHGGSIAYEPQVPHGAGFVILLPFERPPQIPIEEST